jgi:hypothetical protein
VLHRREQLLLAILRHGSWVWGGKTGYSRGRNGITRRAGSDLDEGSTRLLVVVVRWGDEARRGGGLLARERGGVYSSRERPRVDQRPLASGQWSLVRHGQRPSSSAGVCAAGVGWAGHGRSDARGAC